VSLLSSITKPNYRESGSALLLQRSAKRGINNMILEQLLADTLVQKATGNLKIKVEALVTDSRRVTPGAVFFALPGRRTDGVRHIEEAASRGAIAVVSQVACWIPPRLTLIVVNDVRKCLAACARNFYGNPEKKLDLIGVCGTAGKTVVASLLRDFIARREPVGLLGTHHYMLGKRTLPSYRTTPEPTELYGMLSQMNSFDCSKGILEVSSHGIDQGRIDGLTFDSAIFTNLSGEHLDYHGSMENYYHVLKRFLSGETGSGTSKLVVSLDDAYSARILTECGSERKVITYGLHQDADFRASEVVLTSRDSRFTLSWGSNRLRVVSPLIGLFNIQNVLAAIAAATLYGIEPGESAGYLIDFEGVRGRMERVDQGQEISVVVDYAHTEASYRKVIKTLRELTEGRVITVFGCGGDRDRKVRSSITRAVVEGSDVVIATSDNPRSESIEVIFRDMRDGVDTGGKLQFVEDRRQAIAEAIKMAQPGDTVLIAGKGHETFQEYADSVTPFDDRAVAREIIMNQQLDKL
jgi:UDP-N-acetylmuramoyl-L-alanyl-D-glutamate--2,6-diaminopimelate ligase